MRGEAGGPEAWRLRSSRKPEGDCVREVTGGHTLAGNPVLPQAVPLGEASAGYWQVAPPGRRRLRLLGGWRVCRPLRSPGQDGHSIACPGCGLGRQWGVGPAGRGCWEVEGSQTGSMLVTCVPATRVLGVFSMIYPIA